MNDGRDVYIDVLLPIMTGPNNREAMDISCDIQMIRITIRKHIQFFPFQIVGGFELRNDYYFS